METSIWTNKTTEELKDFYWNLEQYLPQATAKEIRGNLASMAAIRTEMGARGITLGWSA